MPRHLLNGADVSIAASRSGSFTRRVALHGERRCADES